MGEGVLREIVEKDVDLGEIVRAVSQTAVAIPCYRRGPKLWRTLWSLNSTSPDVHVHVEEAERCVAANRNAALAKLDTRYVVMMDDDVLLPMLWLEKLMLVLLATPDAGIVGPKMTGMIGQSQNGQSLLKVDEVMDCVMPGTLMLFDRERVTGCVFDEEYLGSQWEDTDFVMQVKAKGLSTLVTGSVWILHDNEFTNGRGDNYVKNKARFKSKWTLPGV